MARISKPYEVISEKKDKKAITKLSEAQEVILKYMQGLSIYLKVPDMLDGRAIAADLRLMLFGST